MWYVKEVEATIPTMAMPGREGAHSLRFLVAGAVPEESSIDFKADILFDLVAGVDGGALVGPGDPTQADSARAAGQQEVPCVETSRAPRPGRRGVGAVRSNEHVVVRREGLVLLGRLACGRASLRLRFFALELCRSHHTTQTQFQGADPPKDWTPYPFFFSFRWPV